LFLNTPDPTHLRLQFHHPPELYPHVHLLQSCPPFSLRYIRSVLESSTVALLAGNNLHAGLDGQKPVPINAAHAELLTPTGNRTVHFEHASRVHCPRHVTTLTFLILTLFIFAERGRITHVSSTYADGNISIHLNVQCMAQTVTRCAL
jgi:hypothetical protein